MKGNHFFATPSTMPDWRDLTIRSILQDPVVSSVLSTIPGATELAIACTRATRRLIDAERDEVVAMCQVELARALERRWSMNGMRSCRASERCVRVAVRRYRRAHREYNGAQRYYDGVLRALRDVLRASQPIPPCPPSPPP